ncbi:hypothetical protein IFR05_015340 [Cadophora sp. M221]|nr:hypothetical protein IFR05_015340 [Cadophora sp. M221]
MEHFWTTIENEHSAINESTVPDPSWSRNQYCLWTCKVLRSVGYSEMEAKYKAERVSENGIGLCFLELSVWRDWVGAGGHSIYRILKTNQERGAQQRDFENGTRETLARLERLMDVLDAIYGRQEHPEWKFWLQASVYSALHFWGAVLSIKFMEYSLKSSKLEQDFDPACTSTKSATGTRAEHIKGKSQDDRIFNYRTTTKSAIMTLFATSIPSDRDEILPKIP